MKEEISIAIKFVLLGWALFMFSCTNDEPISRDQLNDHWFWTPGIVVEKGDEEATLLIGNPLAMINYAGPPPLDPDFFNIWISDTRDGEFTLFGQTDISTSSVTVPDLQNGKPYYFFVTAHKDTRSDSTAVLMTIPSPEADAEVFPANAGSPVENLSASADLSFVTFARNSNLYVKDASSPSPELVDTYSYNASWSPTANRFVYTMNVKEGNFLYPSGLKLFDPVTSNVSTVLEVPYDRYYVQSPSFMPDGEQISFLSSEDNTQKIEFDLWTISPAGVKTRLTNFQDVGFHADGRYSWTNSQEDVYVDGRFRITDGSALYKVNVATGNISPVVESEWSDKNPSLSPDNTKLAFISNRTGKDELWIFDLVTSGYSQLTGSDFVFDSRYTNLQWLDASRLLITVYSGQEWVPVTIKTN